MDNSEATAKGIFAALASVTAEIGAIGLDSECKVSENGRYRYRSIHAFYNTLNPLLGKHGIFIAPEVVSRESEEVELKTGRRATHMFVTMRFHFYHRDGSCVSCLACGEALDTSDKALGKAMSYAHKYCLQQMFLVPTQDLDDPDAVKEDIARFNVARAPARAVASEERGPYYREAFQTLRQKYNGDGKGMFAELTRILGRPIRTMMELSEADAREYLAAANGRQSL